MALSLLTIVFFLDISTAPFAIVEAMMTGSISGVSPTAMVIENMREFHQSLLVNRLIRSTTGTMITIILMRRLLTLSTPFSKLFLVCTFAMDFAIPPKYVLFPVYKTTAMALPLTMFVPMKHMLDMSVMSSYSLIYGNFS